jgi:hypothetical protein
MASVTLVSGSGTTRLAGGTRLSDLPWMFVGGEIMTHTIATATGDVVYYGLDNSNLTVYRLQCYEDITLTPEYADYEKYCNGVKVNARKLESYSATITITDDMIDLYQLRVLARQAAAKYQQVGGSYNIERLTIDNLVQNWQVPVLFEHHYLQEESADDQWMAAVLFEPELSIGDIPIDPTEGWTTELTLSVRRSVTYEGFLALQRHDTTEIV